MSSLVTSNRLVGNKLIIDVKREADRITAFIKDVLRKTGHEKVVVGVSGGIDSTTSLYLLRRVMPEKHIIVVNLPYFSPKPPKLPDAIREISIKHLVDEIVRRSGLSSRSDLEKVRLGNIMARVRMIVLFDLAKKHKALVCGTENRSEYHLAYFTRFGDEASDFEPIRHLYKTQVYQLATYLGVPKKMIDQSPTAGLWRDQTDESEFGFTYEEADQVLYLYFDKKLTVSEITKKGFNNAKKIITWVKKNDYKHKVPYVLSKGESED